MKKVKFQGIMPAMLAPFKKNGQLDLEGVKTNAKFFAKAGCTGITCNGSTGEAVNLSREERIAVIHATREAVGDELVIVAGTGAPTTGEAVQLSQDAIEAGADTVLVITPFNAIPNKLGLYRHYAEIAQLGAPVIVYNLPQHTGVEIDLGTLEKLVKLPTVVGIKESSGNMSYFAEIIRSFSGELSPLTGCDDLTFQAFVLGAPGAILAIGNIAPKMLVQMLDLVGKGRLTLSSGS